MKIVRITIPFHDKPLELIDRHEMPFVAMRPIVDGIGMAWPSQRRKLKKRFASTVTEILTVTDEGKKHAMLCLPLDQLPAWLDTIHAGKAAPHIRDRIHRYQAESYEILRQYWIAAETRRQNIRKDIAALTAKEQISRKRGSEAGRCLRMRRTEKESNALHLRGLTRQLDWVWEGMPMMIL